MFGSLGVRVRCFVSLFFFVGVRVRDFFRRVWRGLEFLGVFRFRFSILFFGLVFFRRRSCRVRGIAKVFFFDGSIVLEMLIRYSLGFFFSFFVEEKK